MQGDACMVVCPVALIRSESGVFSFALNGCSSLERKWLVRLYF